MVKERTKTKNQPKSDLVSRLEVLFEVGNYAAVRKISRSNLDDPAVVQILNRMGPEPLVFWLGVGSVAAAMALALWLVI